MDVCGNVYVSGWGANILQSAVHLNGMPISADAFQSTPPNGFDFYLFVMERDAESLLYGSYMGGSSAREHVDGGTSRFDKYGVVYQSVCGGCGGFSDFPTTSNAWSNTNNSSNCNNLLFKYDFEIVPDADFTVDNLSGCAPLTLTLDNESNDTINSIWDFGVDATVISAGVNPVIQFDHAGQYEILLYITDTICNLQDTAKKIITVYPEIQLSVSNDTILCASGSGNFDLIADSDGTASEFIWSTNSDFSTSINVSPSDSTITINPGTSQTYYIQASNASTACAKVDSVQVFYVGDAFELSADTSICLGDTLLLEANALTSVSNVTYQWLPTSSVLLSVDSIAFVSPTNSSYVYVNIQSGLCTYTDSIYIQVDELNADSVYALAEPEYAGEGEVVVLSAYPDSSTYSYQWFPYYNLDSEYGQTVNAIAGTENQEYVVTVQNGACSVNKTVSYQVYELICGDVYVFVPNAFTPNGDGNNDVLFVRGKNIEEMNFMVFDRWGELVFQSQIQSEGWDGTFKGEALDPDVYVYHLQVICTDGQENLIKGNVTLLK